MLIAVHDWIGDLLEAQVENLETMWSQWIDGRRSAEWTLDGLRRLEARIEAHVDALVLAEDRADPLVQAAMGQGFWSSDLAAGYAMLRSGRPEPAEAALTYFRDADPQERPGVAMALRLGPVESVREALHGLASHDDEETAASAGLVLLGHGLPLPQPGRLAMWRRSENEGVAAQAWLATACVPRVQRSTIGYSEYRPVLEAESEELRDAAFFCGAVSGADWVRAFARDHAAEDRVALRWFGIMAEASDAKRWKPLLAAESIGPERFEAAASFGHASVLEPLLAAMESDDAITAVAAGRAFTRITGHDVESLEKVALVDRDAEENEDYDPDLVDEAYLPDPGQARAYWEKNGGRLSRGTRWLGGTDFSDPAAVMTSELDLRSRFEESVRRHHAARIAAEPTTLDRFPLG